MLIGILKVLRLPPQCTFWRFLASLHISVAGQILRADPAAVRVGSRACGTERDHAGHRNHSAHPVRPPNGRAQELQSEEPGKKSYQPILTFLAETREYVGGELRNGDRPTGQQIARNLASVFAALPPRVETIYARADAGFYCNEAVEAMRKRLCARICKKPRFH